MKIYLVGGAVRDELLDIKNADKIYKLENKTLVEMNMEEEVYDA